MNNNIKELQKKFSEIKNMDYVKSIRKGNTGVGVTFEYLLGKNDDDLEISDYEGIEIKTKRSYSKAYITLFNAVPTGSSYYEVKRLRDNYGYRDPIDHSLKRLNTVVGSKEMVKVGIWYYFKLKVVKEEERIYLYVYDRGYHLIDDSTYWDFDILKEKLYRKLRVLALVKAWPKRKDDIEWFKYYKMQIYILKSFNNFIEMINDGKIVVNFKIGNYYDEKRYGMVASHGVGFCVKEEDLLGLFDIYR